MNTAPDNKQLTAVPSRGLLHTHREILVILAISAILRILLTVETVGGPCWRQYEWKDSDMNFFHSGAVQIASGDILLDRPFHPYHNWHAMFGSREEWRQWYGGKRYYQEPGYYYLAAIFHATFPDGPSALKTFQLLAGLATIFLVYLTAFKLFGKLPAVIAAALLALCGPLYFYDILLLRATMLTFTTALFLFVAAEAFRKKSLRWWFTTGAVLGLLFLLKSTALLLLLATLVIILYFGRRTPGKAAASAGATLGIFVLLLVPLFARNAAVGAPVLSFSSVGSATFVLGNGPKSSGDGLVIPDEMDEIMRKTNGAFWPVVREICATHDSFANVAGLWFAKAYYFFRNHETPNNASFYSFRQCSWVLVFTFVGFWLLTPLMAIGAYAAFKTRPGPQNWLLAAIILSLLAPAVFFFFVSRYRLPAVVPFAIFGGLGVTHILDIIKGKHYIMVGILAVAAVVTGVFFNAWGPQFPGVRNSDYGARAIFYFNRENYDSAAAELKRGLKDYPKDKALNSMLEETLSRMRYEEEEKEMLKALENNPGDAKLHRELALFYVTKLRQPEKAIPHIEKTLRLDPDQPDADKFREALRRYYMQNPKHP
jgi:4-amino-4-deoxy-L-arabinose transferase-like glycosyltransferase